MALSLHVPFPTVWEALDQLLNMGCRSIHWFREGDLESDL